jgi:hypothetical protein
VTGDFLCRLKSGVLHLTLGWSAGGCKKTSESSKVLLRGLAEAIEGREWVAISRSHRVRGVSICAFSHDFPNKWIVRDLILQ